MIMYKFKSMDSLCQYVVTREKRIIRLKDKNNRQYQNKYNPNNNFNSNRNNYSGKSQTNRNFNNYNLI